MPNTITSEFRKHIGAREWDPFVTKMQVWFYGKNEKKAWCALSCSYMANQLGILDQLGGKEQNVYRLMKNTEAAWKKTGKGDFKYATAIPKGSRIKEGTVIYMLKSDPPMTATSSKHATTAASDFIYTGTGYFPALGGNQSHAIEEKNYTQKTIYAIFYPDYGTGHSTLRKGDEGAEVKEMQSDLKKLGFGRITGHTLVARGHFKTNTYNTLKAFQKWTGCCTPDGVCGKKSWAMIDKMLAEPLHTTEAIKTVNVRTGPSTEFKKIGSVPDGTAVQYTNIINGWIYIPAKKGWSKSSYYKL